MPENIIYQERWGWVQEHIRSGEGTELERTRLPKINTVGLYCIPGKTKDISPKWDALKGFWLQ